MPANNSSKHSPTQASAKKPETTYNQTHSLQQAQPHHDFAQVIAISSGKGGVGKTVLATNLGIALANAGKKVCLFDADTNLANVNILLGITPLHTLDHYINQDYSLDEVIINGPGGMDIVAGASGVADFIQFSLLQQKKLIHALRSLEKNYQYLLIDTAAGIDETNISLILAAPYLLLTITEEPTSLTDAFSLLRVLKKYQFHQPVLVIVNMTASSKSAQATFKRFKTAVNKFLHLQLYLAAYVLADKNIPSSIVHQQPLLLTHPESAASQCILKLCERLLTVLDKKNQNNTPFSDYFSDLTIPDDIGSSEQETEFIPAPETPAITTGSSAAEHHYSAEALIEHSALLRASYFARLLGKRKN